MSHPCSRVVARNVRKEMEKQVVKPAVRALGSLPASCPLDPSRDLYGGHEKAKQRKRGANAVWTCGYCGKSFKSEHYLDLHLERNHMDQTPADGVCLADYCEMFEVCGNDARFKRRGATTTHGKKPISCDNVTLAKAKKTCETAMGKCFQLDKGPSRELHAKYSRTFCSMLDCKIREEHHKEQHSDLMPVVVLLIFIVLIGFVVFSVVVCCVDYSDDIIKFLVDSGIASTNMAKGLVKARDGARQGLGMERPRGI